MINVKQQITFNIFIVDKLDIKDHCRHLHHNPLFTITYDIKITKKI